MPNMNDSFDRSEVAPIYWYNRSNDLRGSAAALCAAADPAFAATVADKFGLGDGFSVGIAGASVYEMLCGMSIELMLKAIAVGQRKKVLTHHRLVDLAKHVDFALTREEEGLLLVLTAAIRWSGRYPIPKDRKEWDDTHDVRDRVLWKPSERAPSFKTYNGALQWSNVNALWKKLSGVYWTHHYDV